MTTASGSGLLAQQVRVDYGGGHLALDGASIAVRPGRRLAVIGANGAGKTTLLRVLSGAIKAGSGRVSVDGIPLRHKRSELNKHRTRVQLVLQDPDDQLFSAQVYADVSFGPTNLGLDLEAVRDRVERALRQLEISALADRPIHELSYGQRKRVAIAGAVAMQPRYLLLDEPTAGLDPAGVEALVATLGELERAGTVVALSTHDLDFAWRWADDVCVVHCATARQGAAHAMLGDAAGLVAAGLRTPWQAELLQLAGVHLGGLPGPRTVAEVAAAIMR